MTKPFLIIQLRKEDEATNSELNCILKYGQLNKKQVVRIRAEVNGLPSITLNNYSGVMVGGSPFDISTPQDQKSSIQKKVESDFNRLLKQVIEYDFPFIGMCSGSGLLGNYCGANISKKYSEPVGGVDITLTNAGLTDPLLIGLPKQFRALVGHKEACDNIPPNAVHLASSKTCPIQMFRIKTNVYATQFHPEADANEFILRVNIYKNYGYFPAKDAQKIINKIKNEKIIIPRKILQRFVKRYQR